MLTSQTATLLRYPHVPLFQDVHMPLRVVLVCHSFHTSVVYVPQLGLC
jgi:hypothetical protein